MTQVIRTEKRNLFVVARNGVGGMISHDPRSGKAKKFEYDTSESPNDVLGAMTVFASALETARGNEALAKANITVYTLDGVAIRAYEIVKHLKEAKGDVNVAKEAIQGLLLNRLENITDEELDLVGRLVEDIAALPNLTIRRISQVSTMSNQNLYARTLKKLVNLTWNLCPVPELSFEDDSADGVSTEETAF